jgi:hypothetical protein
MPQGPWTLIIDLWALSLHYKAASLNLTLLKVLYRREKVLEGGVFLYAIGNFPAPER